MFGEGRREGGGWYGSTTVALSLSPLPLEKGIPDHKLELISETATGDQVRGPRREKGHELSNMRFLLYRDMQHGDVLAYAERQDIFLV